MAYAVADALPQSLPGERVRLTDITDSKSSEASVRKLLDQVVTVSKLVRKPDTGALRSIEASVKSWTLTGNIYQTRWEGAEHNLARDDARVCIQSLGATRQLMRQLRLAHAWRVLRRLPASAMQIRLTRHPGLTHSTLPEGAQPSLGTRQAACAAP